MKIDAHESGVHNRFLNDPGDMVLDIFAGSNTTGEVAEAEGRRWMAFEERPDYVAASAFRFRASDDEFGPSTRLYSEIRDGQSVNLRRHEVQQRLQL